MSDRLGKEGDFSNSLIIFTSNIGSEHIVGLAGQGVSEQLGKRLVTVDDENADRIAVSHAPPFTDIRPWNSKEYQLSSLPYQQVGVHRPGSARPVHPTTG